MAVNRDEVAAQFEELLVEQFSVPREAITPDAHVFDDLGLDSIDLLSALAIVENQYEVAIPNEDLPDMLIVGDCITKITDRINSAGVGAA